MGNRKRWLIIVAGSVVVAGLVAALLLCSSWNGSAGSAPRDGHPTATPREGVIGFEEETVTDPASALRLRAVFAEGAEAPELVELRITVPGIVVDVQLDGVPLLGEAAAAFESDAADPAADRVVEVLLPAGTVAVHGRTSSEWWVLGAQQWELAAGADAAEAAPMLQSIALVPTRALNDRLRSDIDAWLEGCAQSTEISPPGCPFSYWDTAPGEVSWSITSAPGFTIDYAGPSTALLHRGEQGVAALHYTNAGAPLSIETRFVLYGPVDLGAESFLPAYFAG